MVRWPMTSPLLPWDLARRKGAQALDAESSSSMEEKAPPARTWSRRLGLAAHGPFGIGTPPKWANAWRWQSKNVAKVLAGGEAAERAPRVGQEHVERVDLRDSDVGEDLAHVFPVGLGLCCGDHFEPAVDAGQGAG